MTFKNNRDLLYKSESLKNIAIALAIIIGGSWTLYTYWSLQASSRAQAELDELNSRVYKQPVLMIEIDMKQTKLAMDTHKYIAGSVNLTNIGKRNATLKFTNDNPPLVISRVIFDENNNLEVVKKYTQYPIKYSGYTIRVGDTEKIPFFVKVGKAGLYFIDFEVDIHEQNFKESPSTSWATSKFIEIRE